MIIEALEKRTLPKDADKDSALMALFGGGRRAACGTDITDKTALTSSAVLCGTRLLSEIIAALPKHTYRRLTKPHDKERAYDHPLYRVLHDQFNPYMSAFDGWRWLQGNAIVNGMGVAQIEYARSGRIASLWPLPASRVKIVRAGAGLAYEYWDAEKGVRNAIPYDEVFRYSGFSLSGLAGLALAENSKEIIGNSLAMEEYTGRFFGNNATPPSYITVAGALEEEDKDRLRDSVEAMYGGLSNAHRVAVLEEGTTWQTLGISPKDSLLIEGKTFQIQEVARILNIPPCLLHDHSRSTFSNIEQLAIAFRIYSVWLWVANIENAINTQLFTATEQQKYFSEFLMEGLERADTLGRAQASQAEIYAGTKTRNEVRAMNNLAPLEFLDDPLVPVNYTTAKQISNPPQLTPPAPPAPRCDCGTDHESRTERRADGNRIALRRAFWPMLQDAGRRLAKAEARRLRDIVKKNLRSRGEAELTKALEAFYTNPDQMPAVVAAILGPVFRAYADAMAAAAAGQIDGTPPDLTEWVNGYVEIAAREYDNSHLFQLTGILRDTGPDEDAIEERIGEWEEKTGDKMADKESTGLGEAVAMFVFGSLGVTRFRWQNVGATCPICQEIDGKVVGREESFLGHGDPINYTKEDGTQIAFKTSTNVMHPPLHTGCDCVVNPE